MKVHKVTLRIIDDDQLGAERVAEMVRRVQRDPDGSIYPRVVAIETRDVDWSYEHPLNFEISSDQAFNALFSKESVEEVNASKNRVDAAEAELQRLTQQQEERESTIREQAARISELIAATNDTDKPVVERQWETIWKLRDTAATLEAELKRLTQGQAAERVSSEPFDGAMLRSGPNGTREWFGPVPEASPSVDAVDPSAGIQERGPRAHEDL